MKKILPAHRQILEGYMSSLQEGTRKFTLLVGPTNSGKTRVGIDALAAALSGVYLGPLRLLAAEVAEKMNEEYGVPCSLVTGEERREIAGARHVASTVEMLDLREHFAVAVIDEAQMLADPSRGGSWTRALCGVNADEVFVCLAPEAEDLVKEIIELCGDEVVEVRHLSRLTPLEFDESFGFFSDIEPGDAIVCFSIRGVNEVAATVSQRCRLACSRIYGAMPYEVRKKEEERFSSGKTAVLVATDAIGMGLNLPVKRVIFYDTNKFDGTYLRGLLPPEVKQIAGRAGRYGLHEAGKYGAFASAFSPGRISGDQARIHEAYEAEPEPLRQAYVSIPRTMFGDGEYVSDVYARFLASEGEEDSLFANADVREKAWLAARLEFELWWEANAEGVRDAFFDAAEEAGYLADTYAVEWIMARDEIVVDGLVDVRGQHAELIRRFSEFPVSQRNDEAMSKWLDLFRREIHGDRIEDVYEYSYEDRRYIKYTSQKGLEETAAAYDVVAYYELRFGTEKGYQEARRVRNEFIKELGDRLDEADAAD